MPNAFDDNTAETETASDPSPENETEEDSDPVSEDENTPEESDDPVEDDDTEDAEGAEDASSAAKNPSKPLPFHKNPRFRQLNAQVKELKEKLEAAEKNRAETERLAKASPEEKAVWELSHKYGFVQKGDVERVEKAIAAMKDEQDFKAFLEKHPEASTKTEALKALAYTPTYIRSTYEEIYKDLFAGDSESKGTRKVVARRTRTGMRPISSGSANSEKGSAHVFTRAELTRMDDKTYEKNRKEIQKQMREGLIK